MVVSNLQQLLSIQNRQNEFWLTHVSEAKPSSIGFIFKLFSIPSNYFKFLDLTLGLPNYKSLATAKSNVKLFWQFENCGISYCSKFTHHTISLDEIESLKIFLFCLQVGKFVVSSALTSCSFFLHTGKFGTRGMCCYN